MNLVQIGAGTLSQTNSLHLKDDLMFNGVLKKHFKLQAAVIQFNHPISCSLKNCVEELGGK